EWKSPVLLIHGDDDRVVAFQQSIDLKSVSKTGALRWKNSFFPTTFTIPCCGATGSRLLKRWPNSSRRTYTHEICTVACSNCQPCCTPAIDIEALCLRLRTTQLRQRDRLSTETRRSQRHEHVNRVFPDRPSERRLDVGRRRRARCGMETDRR